VVDTLGVGQDNVVFMGRRSFRMETVGGHDDEEVTIPKRASEIPTDRIFDTDRERATREALAAMRSRSGLSSRTWLALCSGAFALGIGLTLALSGRPAPPPAMQAALAAPPAPAPAIVIEPVPPAPSAVAAPAPLPALARRPLAKPVHPARPRPVRAVPAEAPAAKPWVDPFE
jgi:hypothetical protein